MKRREGIGAAVVLVVTLATRAASAEDLRETARAFPGREPAARVVIEAPPVVPEGYTLDVTIDGVTLPSSRFGVPVPVAPGERRITYAARRDGSYETRSFDLAVGDGVRPEGRALRTDRSSNSLGAPDLQPAPKAPKSSPALLGLR
jgi:hypothetical protein